MVEPIIRNTALVLEAEPSSSSRRYTLSVPTLTDSLPIQYLQDLALKMSHEDAVVSSPFVSYTLLYSLGS